MIENNYNIENDEEFCIKNGGMIYYIKKYLTETCKSANFM